MVEIRHSDERPELVFAFVGAAGVRLSDMRRVLVEYLRSFGYESIEVSLSELLKNFRGWRDENETDPSEYTRITNRQELALQFRQKLNDGAALAIAAIAKIREERAAISGNPNQPANAYAYILPQLKHPSEVALLREVYGASFYLLAGHATDDVREKGLAALMAQKDDQPGEDRKYLEKARHIIEIDLKQEDEKGLGQNTRDTYPLADFFANIGKPSGEFTVQRFVDLLFGHPFHTPYPEEYSMYQASSVSLRSSDENRQVGAVIVRLTRNPSSKITNADVVTSGMNEVPRRGGGFYWHEDSPDGREQWLIAYRDDDRAQKIKISALKELIEKMERKHWFSDKLKQSSAKELARDLLSDLKGTQFMNIGEFMRPVHAEMAALIDGARRGVAVNDLTMYVTTFPCHNCAKHIIAAGIRQVVYLEPYPKSRADFLHGEEINLNSVDGLEHDERVIFLAFSGVAPRQYGKVFSMAARGRKNGFGLKDWPVNKASLFPTYVGRYVFDASVLAERDALKKLDVETYAWNKEVLG